MSVRDTIKNSFLVNFAFVKENEQVRSINFSIVNSTIREAIILLSIHDTHRPFTKVKRKCARG